MRLTPISGERAREQDEQRCDDQQRAPHGHERGEARRCAGERETEREEGEQRARDEHADADAERGHLLLELERGQFELELDDAPRVFPHAVSGAGERGPSNRSTSPERRLRRTRVRSLRMGSARTPSVGWLHVEGRPETSSMTLRAFLDLSCKLLRVRRLALLPVVIACLGFASTASATPAFRDTVGSKKAAAALAEWGGPTAASDGEIVTIFLSSTYPVDPALAKQWADFMTSLIHGPELATVSIHLAPLAEVQRICGIQALACYSPRDAAIYAPGEDPSSNVYAKGVLAHEYGHHIAASRLNPPFSSVDYGTKRWATYENVCAKAGAGYLYPGAEDDRHYMLNPGEAFAESYRLLNEQRLALPQESWDIVTRSLLPDATALSLLEQDILTPWTANTTRRPDRDAHVEDPHEKLHGQYAVRRNADGRVAAVGSREGPRRASCRRQHRAQQHVHARGRGVALDHRVRQAGLQAARDASRPGHEDDEDDRDVHGRDAVTTRRLSSASAARAPRRSLRPPRPGRRFSCRPRP